MKQYIVQVLMQLPVTLECLKQVWLLLDLFVFRIIMFRVTFHWQGNMGKLVKQLTKQENQGVHYIE